MRWFLMTVLTARESKAVSNWRAVRLVQWVATRAEFETSACWDGWGLCCRELLMCGKAGTTICWVSLMANGWFWQNEMVAYLCDVLSSKLTSKIPHYASWGYWNTTRWAWGIFSAMAFHCLHCCFGELLCERVHFANKKFFFRTGP